MLFAKATKVAIAGLAASALAVGSTPALANPCAAGVQGCVLPVGEPAPPPPPPVQTVAVDEDVDGGGLGILPILVGLAALAAAYFLFINDDEEELPITPA